MTESFEEKGAVLIWPTNNKRAMDVSPRKYAARLKKTFRQLKKQFRSLEAGQRRIVRLNLADLKRRAAGIRLLFSQPKRYHEVDDMFFGFEELPLFGKEYWFLKFTGGAEDLRQLILTFGRSAGDVKVNRTKMKSSLEAGAEKECMVIGWCFDKTKKVFADASQKVAVSRRKTNVISSDSEKTGVSFSLSGAYPSYSLEIKHKGKKVADLKMSKPKKGRPFEMSQFYKGNLGFQLINIYFDFQGELYGKKLGGKCYLQKVIGVGPFVPWRWARFIFRNGSVFDAFVMNVEALGLKQPVYSLVSFQDEKGKFWQKRTSVNFEKIRGKNPRWVVSAPDGKMVLEAESYSRHPFVFSSRYSGKFTYLEYLSKVNDFYLEKGGKHWSLAGCGPASGLVEDAYGFML